MAVTVTAEKRQNNAESGKRRSSRLSSLALCVCFLLGWAGGSWRQNSSEVGAVVVNAKKIIKTSATRSSDPPVEIPDGIEPKIWPSWPSERPFPCFHEEEEDHKNSVDRGFIFVKPSKVGGSTAVGIHMRIARNIRNRQNITHECLLRYHHGTAISKVAAKNGTFSSSKMFLWSIVRQPKQREISAFFHFTVSREKVDPTDKNFQEHLKGANSSIGKLPGHYLPVLSMGDIHLSNGTEISAPMGKVQAILDSYDFIAITERMDESIVVLQLLLGLTTSDVLYMSAKTNGGFDDGRYKYECKYIVPSFISPGMNDFFANDPWWQEYSKWDYILYQAANISLDRTIDGLGKQFLEALERFKWAKLLVAERCADKVVFPCTAGGKRVKSKKTDCLWEDSGCGTSCIDAVVEEFRI